MQPLSIDPRPLLSHKEDLGFGPTTFGLEPMI